MTVSKLKFKKTKALAKEEKRSVVEIKLPEVTVANGVFVASKDGSKKSMLATYRAIKKQLAKRKGEKYRVIWLLKSFLIYRLK